MADAAASRTGPHTAEHAAASATGGSSPSPTGVGSTDPAVTDRAEAGSPFPPFLPAGRIVRLAGRGEMFVRQHVHPDPAAPTVLLLHGWTASADLQFIAAYEALAEVCSFVGVDHRGHGRGLRSFDRYELEDVADDAAAVCRELGLAPVVAVGYSMGGPVALHLTRRHPDLVAGLVLQATALEWRATLRERVAWRLVPLFGSAIRSWLNPYVLRRGVRTLVRDDSPLAPYRDWLAAETMRNDARVMVEAGKALSRYDARPWAASLGVPAGVLVSTRDRLVKPNKQRALAAAVDGDVVEVAMDHLGAIERPAEFATATVALIRRVAAAD
ncbi:MAG: alpha/beta hydrolase [Actinomycetota bacterium]